MGTWTAHRASSPADTDDVILNGCNECDVWTVQEVDVQLDEARQKLQAHTASLEEAQRALTLLRGDAQKLDAKRDHLRSVQD